MVADLLQLRHRRQDGAAALHAVDLVEGRGEVVHHRLVERHLLPAEPALDVALDLVRQIRGDLRVRLQTPQHEGARQPAQALAAVGVPVALDRDGEAPPERRGAAQQPRVEEVHERVQLAQPVLHGRARQGDAAGRGERTHRPALACAGVLDRLGLVQHQPVPLVGGQILLVPGGQGVGGDQQIGVADLLRQGLAREAIGSVVDGDAQRRHEARGLLRPVPDHRQRADQQGRSGSAGLRHRLAARALAREQRQDLHRLSEPHVVGEARAQAAALQEGEPGQAPALVRPESAHEVGAGTSRAGAGVPDEQLPERALRLDAHHGQAGGSGLQARGEAQQLDGRQLLRPVALGLQRIEGRGDLGRLDLDPAAPHAHEGDLRRRHGPQLVFGELLVADGRYPGELEQGVAAHLAPHHVRLLRLRPRPHLEPQPGAAIAPPGRHEHAEARLLQEGHPLPKEGPGPLRVGGESARRRFLEHRLQRRVKAGRGGQGRQQVLLGIRARRRQDLR